VAISPASPDGTSPPSKSAAMEEIQPPNDHPAIIWLVLPFSDGLHRGPAAGILRQTLALIVAIATVVAGLFGAMGRRPLHLPAGWPLRQLPLLMDRFVAPFLLLNGTWSPRRCLLAPEEAAPGAGTSCWCLLVLHWRRETPPWFLPRPESAFTWALEVVVWPPSC